MADLNQNEIDALLRNMGMKDKENSTAKKEKDKESLSPLDAEDAEKGPVVEKVEFAQLKKRNISSAQGKPDISRYQNIPLVLSGELGTAEITVRDLLKLEEGSIIKLNKMAGESASVLLNGQYLGQAEVVVINDRFGLRVTALGAEEEKETALQAFHPQTQGKEQNSPGTGDGDS